MDQEVLHHGAAVTMFTMPKPIIMAEVEGIVALLANVYDPDSFYQGC